jgi:hypothetical protein
MKAFESHSEASYYGHQTGMASVVNGRLRCNYVDSQGRVIGYVDEEIDPRFCNAAAVALMKANDSKG